MPTFKPKANDEFSLRIKAVERHFRAIEHPNAPGIVHGMDGGKAVVYRILDLIAGDDEYAFKVMKVKYQDPALEEVCDKLDKLKAMPGLQVCERLCLSPSSAPEALKQYKNLQYAILMPWIQGQSWFDALYLGKQGQAAFTKDQSFHLAFNFAEVLAGLEKDGLAHCDLSPGNVIFDLSDLEVELIDVEDIFVPGFQTPGYVPVGTPGYQHRTSGHGQWNGKADRFAGAILLGEMLGWHDDKVRAASYVESYFDPSELQTSGCQRFKVLADVLAEHHPALADLLGRAWESPTLNECPTINEWHQTLTGVKAGVIWKRIEPAISRKKKNPFWATFKELPPRKSRTVQVNFAPLEVESKKRPTMDPVRWVNSPIQRPAKRPNPEPVKWIGGVPDSSGENGTTE